MDFGIRVTSSGISPRYYRDLAINADQVGFESIWLPEHLGWPATMPPTYPYSETGSPPATPSTPLFDAWVALAYLAGATRQIKFGTGVYILPLRHPLVTARAVLTLDRFSGGRAILGIGVGWLEEEFEVVGEDFPNRGPRTDEIIEILKKVWTEDTIEHHGEFYDFAHPVKFEPKPLRKPYPPILVGGLTRPALRRAARLGDGWIAVGQSASGESLKAGIETINRYRREVGREHEPFEIQTDAGNASIDEIRRLEDLGVTRVVVAPYPTIDQGRPSVDHALAGLEDYADRVIAKL